MHDILVNGWNQSRGPIKGWRNNLTTDDLDNINGTYDTLISLLQKKHGYVVLVPPKPSSATPSRIRTVTS
ncbi:MAG: hypothetical protein HZB51_16635 [Chloroflexi bacterium]|nr:hypothetical protein [Chloroflexota bacterium]